MTPLRSACWLLAILSLIAATANAAAPARWTIHTLGDLAGGIGGSTALAINNRGQIVGEATAAVPGGGYALHAFIWEDGVMRDMGTPPGRTMSGAEELNDRGTAVVGDGLGGTYLWRDGAWSPLTFGGFVNDINRFEAMTGAYAPIAGRSHAFIYRDGVVQDLGTLGGRSAAGEAINDRGVVVGRSTIAGESAIHPFIWRDGVMTDLGSLGGFFSVASDVNNHGIVVGTAVDAVGGAYAFISDGSPMQRLLPDLPSPQRATAINDRGAVVGDLGQNGSFLYEDGTVTLLESIPEVRAAGWTRLIPTGMNNRGWITGWGIRASGGSTQSFVLIPR
jgi:probable HAF family extracellular repeat protein